MSNFQKTPRERIQSLLKIHGGHCFITSMCADFASLESTARAMEREGLVVVTEATGLKGLDIKRKSYRPQRAGMDEREEPTH